MLGGRWEPLVNSDEHAGRLFFSLSGTSPFLPPEGVLNPLTETVGGVHG